jgi:hypothetical protein
MSELVDRATTEITAEGCLRADELAARDADPVLSAGQGADPLQARPRCLCQRARNQIAGPSAAMAAATTTPASGGYYPLRSAARLWLDFWPGLLLDTTGRPNGLNQISIKLFSAESAASEIGHSTDPGRFASGMIDNTPARSQHPADRPATR